MKTKNIFIKLLVSLLIVITLANFICVKYSFADEPTTSSDDERTNRLIEENTSGWSAAIINAFKSLVLAPFRAARSLNFALASAGGTTEDVSDGEITPFDIFFNRFHLLDANIFSISEDIHEDNIVYKIRSMPAMWYYSIRTLAIGIIAIILLLNLIKAYSKSSTAEQKASAKTAISDWVLSFALLMFMHIIVIMVLAFNDVILKALENFTEFSSTSNFLNALENAVFAQNLTLGIACLVVYGLMNWQTLKYILVYIQRLLTIVLLVMISPLIPLSYSLDKMRGGNGAALNSWFKELCFNVFVQSLHALVYTALVGVSMAALTSSSISAVSDLGIALVAVASMLFVKYAEKMVKTIFGFDSSQVINHNVLSESFSSLGHAAVSIKNRGMNTARRVATGGPLVSFGQNVDGSHIGIGQVARGVRNNIRNTTGAVRNAAGNAAGAVKNSVGNTRAKINRLPSNIGSLAGSVVSTVKNYPNEFREARDAIRDGYRSKVGNPNNEQNESSESESVIGRDGASQDVSNQVGREGSSPNNIVQGNQYIELENDTNNDQSSTRQIEDAIEQVNKNNKQETKTNETNKTEKLEENITNSTTELTEENTQVEENTEETTEILGEENNKLNNINNIGNIEIGSNGEASKELFDKFKGEMKDILNDNKLNIEKLAQDEEDKLRELEDKLDEKTKNDIIDSAESVWGDQEKIQEFLNSFDKGSLERQYAEAYLRMNTFTDPNENNSIETLRSLYNANGLNIPKEVSEIKDEKQIDKLQLKEDSKPKFVLHDSEQKGEKENNLYEENINEKSSTVKFKIVDSTSNTKFTNNETPMQKAIEDLSNLDSEEFDFEGKTKEEINKIVQKDLEIRNKRIENRIRESGSSNVNGIMSNEERVQLNNYRNAQRNGNNFDVSKLTGIARELAIIDRESALLGYEMSVQGKTTQVDTSSEVIGKLRLARQNQQNQNNRQNNIDAEGA